MQKMMNAKETKFVYSISPDENPYNPTRRHEFTQMRTIEPSIVDSDIPQMFPVLELAEIERLRRFGAVHTYQTGETLAEMGNVAVGLIIILEGTVDVIRTVGSKHREPIVTHGPGSFLGELAQLAGHSALVDAVACEPVEVLIISADRLRALLVAESQLGERIVRALILRRVGLLETEASHQASAVFRGGIPPRVLRRICDYIDANLEESISLDQLAKLAGFSKYHFARNFKQATGLSPHAYLLKRRADRARKLLSDTNMPIAEVALAAGFSHQSHFTSRFREEFKMTPRAYRWNLR